MTAPKQVNFIRTANNSYVGEGSQTISLSTPAFTGDLLVHNNEVCTGGGNAGGTDQSVGGINLVDVTNPKTHKVLAQGFGDTTAGQPKTHTVHSAFAWQPSTAKAYAVLVDNEESADIDIADITDPRQPRIIAEYDLDAGTVTVAGKTAPSGIPTIADPVKGASESFLHDMVVKQIDGRQVMLASYWDGGYVKLDVTDPTRAKYIADSDFAAVDEQLLEQTGQSRVPEGNAHQGEFSADNTFILAADEDFSPYSLVARNESDNAPFEANSGDGTEQIEPGTKVGGQTVFGGRACPGDAAVPTATKDGQIAVLERGVCTFTEKVAAVEAANGAAGPDYAAALIFNRKGSDACTATLGMSVEGGIPAFGVTGRDVGLALFDKTIEADCLSDTSTTPLADLKVGALGDTVSFDSYFDGWGYLRLFANGTKKLKQLDTFAIPEAMDAGKAVGFGDLSVHEVAFSERKPGLAYVSYYAGGTRVYDVSSGKIKEVAHHIDADGSNVWGVQVFSSGGKEYVISSDRDYGVQIFEYAPANRP